MHGFGALFGAILGFAAAIVPEAIQMLKDRFSAKRELEAKQQELEALSKGYEYSIKTQQDLLTQQSSEIWKLQAQISDCDEEATRGHVVLRFIQSSVRPIITYSFFLLFAVVKFYALHHALHVDHTPVSQMLPLVWDEDTESLFAAIITFWFGSRAINSTSPGNQRVNADARHPSNLKGTAHVVGE